MASIISFLQAHGIATIIAVFTFLSLVLTAVGTLLTALGKSVPGWLGSVISVLGSIVHFLNGNVTASASAASDAKASPSA